MKRKPAKKAAAKKGARKTARKAATKKSSGQEGRPQGYAKNRCEKDGPQGRPQGGDEKARRCEEGQRQEEHAQGYREEAHAAQGENANPASCASDRVSRSASHARSFFRVTAAALHALIARGRASSETHPGR